MNTDYLRRLRLLGMVEGTSTLLLFGVAMPLKYLAGIPQAVTVLGWIHGVLFVALAVAFQRAVERVPISARLASAGVVGALAPFGPFVVDVWLRRLEREGTGGEA